MSRPSGSNVYGCAQPGRSQSQNYPSHREQCSTPSLCNRNECETKPPAKSDSYEWPASSDKPVAQTTNETHSPIGAVLLYYKLGVSVEHTIVNLLTQSCRIERLILVDNNSKDGILTQVCSNIAEEFAFTSEIEVLTLDENLGYSGGMNAGYALLRQTPKQLVETLFVTHEAVLEIDCLNALNRGLNSQENPGAVGPVLKRTGDGTVWSMGGQFDHLGNPYHSTTHPGSKLEWLDGACLLVKNASYEMVNGFDSSYFLYWEDVDFTNRIKHVSEISCVADAHASQETGTAPIYFKTRGQVKYWLERRKWRFVASLAAKTIALMLYKDFRSLDVARAKLRLAGFVDGISNRKRSDLPMLRELP